MTFTIKSNNPWWASYRKDADAKTATDPVTYIDSISYSSNGPTSWAYQATEYTTNYAADVTGYKYLGQYNGKAAKAYTVIDTTITTEWDARTAAKSVVDQIKSFGKFNHFAMKNASSSKKYEKKMSALNKTLTAAFYPLVSSKDWLSLDQVGEIVDTSTEEVSDAATEAIDKVKAALTDDQWKMVALKASGMDQKDIAKALGVSGKTISIKFKAIKEIAVKVTGFETVAF